MNEVRLIDVFMSGPLQIIVSTYITHSPLLRYFMLMTRNRQLFNFSHRLLVYPTPRFQSGFCID